MAVVTHENVQALQDDGRVVEEEKMTTDAGLSARVAKLEGRFEESDKHSATKADVEAVRVEVADVKSDVRVLRVLLICSVPLIIVLDKLEWQVWVQLLFRLLAGGVP